MKKVVLSCVFSVISFANVFGMIPPEEKSALTMPETSFVKDVVAINKDIHVFSDFLEEHKDEQTLSPTNQAELRQRFINLEPAFTALLSFSNKDIYDCLKPFILNLYNFDSNNYDKLKVACLHPEDYKKVNYTIQNIGSWYFDTRGTDFRGSGADYTKINKTLVALCKLIPKLTKEIGRFDGDYCDNSDDTENLISFFLKDAETLKDFTSFFFINMSCVIGELDRSLRYHCQ